MAQEVEPESPRHGARQTSAAVGHPAEASVWLGDIGCGHGVVFNVYFRFVVAHQHRACAGFYMSGVDRTVSVHGRVLRRHAVVVLRRLAALAARLSVRLATTR